MISTRRHLEYASGYLALGMLAAAARELAAISAAELATPGVLSVRVDYLMQARQWELLVDSARAYAGLSPETDKGWIYWAYALRELGRIAAARQVLLEAEPRHGAACPVLHYNLACYACLLGDRPEARRRLALAFKQDLEWKASALEDPDLEAMRTEIEAMK